MKILILMLLPFMACSQYDTMYSRYHNNGEWVTTYTLKALSPATQATFAQHTKFIDSTTGVLTTGTRLRLKTDSLAVALAATNAALLALKCNLTDTAGMLTNYLRKAGSAANLTGFPTFNQNTTGTAGGLSANIAESQVTNLVSDLALKAPLASPTFTGTVSGVTATMVGLGNVTNESKATMFTSPAFTGTPTGIGFPVYARVTGSNATTTGQALVTITGLSLSLVANATYEVECMLSASTTAVTTGTGYGINYSAAGATIEGFVQGSLTNATDKTLRLNAFNTSSQAWLTTSAQTGGILIKGVVTVGANAGTLTAQHLKVTSGTSTIFIGSYIKATRIL